MSEVHTTMHVPSSQLLNFNVVSRRESANILPWRLHVPCSTTDLHAATSYYPAAC